MHRLLVLFAGTCLVIALGGSPSTANWTFTCEDGSMVTFGRADFALMHEHPCVKAWQAATAVLIEQDRLQRTAGPERYIAEPIPGALTDGQRRLVRLLVEIPRAPGASYALRPRTVFVRSYVRKDGTSVRSHFRSAPRFRGTSGRRGRRR